MHPSGEKEVGNQEDRMDKYVDKGGEAMDKSADT